jgi:hypothetical protein
VVALPTRILGLLCRNGSIGFGAAALGAMEGAADLAFSLSKLEL